MDAFLSRFMTAVDDHIGDPSQAKRYPYDKKLRDFRTIETVIWEKLMRASGQESTIGRCEQDYTLVDGQSFYSLPGNFRQFMSFQRRQDGDRNKIIGWYESISMYDPAPGIEILDAQRGFLIRPTPILGSSETWTLTYMKGPVLLHYATAASVTSTSLTGAAPASAAAGEIVMVEDFYNGCFIRVYSALTGAGQTRVVSDFSIATGSPVFTIRDAWTTTPTSDGSHPILYEICPVLPSPYDEIYALDVAIAKAGKIGLFAQKNELIRDRGPLWDACRNYVASNVSDRMPRRSARQGWDETDPYPEY